MYSSGSYNRTYRTSYPGGRPTPQPLKTVVDANAKTFGDLPDDWLKADERPSPVYSAHAMYEDGQLGLYNVIVTEPAYDFKAKISRAERMRLEELRDAVERILGPLSPDSYIAGGALTSLIANQPVGDVDVFGDAAPRLMAILKESGYKPYFENSFVANYEVPELNKWTNKLQIIKKPITLRDYFKQLDNVANGITIGSRGAVHVLDSLIYSEAAIELCRRKQIRINLPLAYPRQALARALKYIARGWKIEPTSLANLVMLAGLDIDQALNDGDKRKKPDLELFTLISIHETGKVEPCATAQS